MKGGNGGLTLRDLWSMLLIILHLRKIKPYRSKQ
jgi:hypothetical protein